MAEGTELDGISHLRQPLPLPVLPLAMLDQQQQLTSANSPLSGLHANGVAEGLLPTSPPAPPASPESAGFELMGLWRLGADGDEQVRV